MFKVLGSSFVETGRVVAFCAGVDLGIATGPFLLIAALTGGGSFEEVFAGAFFVVTCALLAVTAGGSGFER